MRCISVVKNRFKAWGILPFLFFSLPTFAIEISPEQALKRLMDGNARYVDNRLEHPNRSKESRMSTAAGQSPFAIILGCSDSRVSPEILFDQGIGDLFIVRVAGNILGPVELDSIEFSSLYLGSSIIIVLGHQGCGAVYAVLNDLTKDIQTIASFILPAIKNEKKKQNRDLDTAVKDNVRYVVNRLKKSPIIAGLIEKNQIDVVGAYYDFISGKVQLLTEETE